MLVLYIIHGLHIPQAKAKKEMLQNMSKIYDEVSAKYKLTAADFPKQEQYKAFFAHSQVHMSEMPKLSDFEKETKKVCSKLFNSIVCMLFQ